jgi:hypothetical protein
MILEPDNFIMQDRRFRRVSLDPEVSRYSRAFFIDSIKMLQPKQTVLKNSFSSALYLLFSRFQKA